MAHFMSVFRKPQLLSAAPAVCFQQCRDEYTNSCILHPACNFVSSLTLKSELNIDTFVIAAIIVLGL